MSNPLNDIALALLQKALDLNSVQGGRTGEGGQIPKTPYVEIGDGQGEIEFIAAGYGQRRHVVQFYAIFYVPALNVPDEEKATLRQIYWDYYEALKSDLTLGGLCEQSQITGYQTDITERDKRSYWYWATQIEVIYDG